MNKKVKATPKPTLNGDLGNKLSDDVIAAISRYASLCDSVFIEDKDQQSIILTVLATILVSMEEHFRLKPYILEGFLDAIRDHRKSRRT